MKKIVITILILFAIGVGAWYTGRGEESKVSYRFVEVEQGDIESTVSATGTLSAVRTVDVGTQVSGQIDDIFVDYNDRVKQGQLIARIDPTLLRQAVAEAEVSLQRAQAQLTHAEKVYERTRQLHEDQVATDSEFETAEYELAVARASVASAQTSLERAERNLGYSEIYAPVNGVVVERNVDVGQTVAASLSAPTLFLIAEDLSQLEILASVDESDIGRIKDGMDVRFTVQAYPDETFYGKVRQVRLQSTSVENVVTYTVAIRVDNADGKLLPGMTATVDFLVESVENVLKVPNAALRFRPTEEMMAQLQARRTREAGSGDSTRAVIMRPGAGPGSGNVRRGDFGGERPANMAMLWYLDETGNVAALPVRTGITDGQATAIEPLRGELEPGLQVIAGVTSGAPESTVSNPFQNNGGQGQIRFRPGGF